MPYGTVLNHRLIHFPRLRTVIFQKRKSQCHNNKAPRFDPSRPSHRPARYRQVETPIKQVSDINHGDDGDVLLQGHVDYVPIHELEQHDLRSCVQKDHAHDDRHDGDEDANSLEAHLWRAQARAQACAQAHALARAHG